MGLYSCVRRITPPLRAGAQVLVVEGLVTTDSMPYTIRLSYTGKLLNASAHIDSNQNYINDAVVYIRNDHGDSTLCSLTSPGTYQSVDSSFIGTTGYAYTLIVHLSNGKTYVSSPETINPVPPIDSISVTYDSSYIAEIRPTQLVIAVNTHDPASTRNFYRWTASGYYPRKSMGDSCRPFSIWCTDPYYCSCAALCEQFTNDDAINIFSDQLVNGREISQTVFYSPVYWYGKHFAEIKQYSLSEPAYEFWQQYLVQTNRTGSILDPLPAPLVGNIHNLADSNDVALGLFSAAGVFTKKVTIVPFAFQQYWLASTAGKFIQYGDCHMDYPNTLDNDADAPGWENAQEIDLH
jgi:hypothetical protein